jgi:hypothetical protein
MFPRKPAGRQKQNNGKRYNNKYNGEIIVALGCRAKRCPENRTVVRVFI